MMNDTGGFCLKCNSQFNGDFRTKEERKNEAMTLWLWVLGIIVFAAIMGPVSPVGVIVVIGAVAALQLFTNRKK